MAVRNRVTEKNPKTGALPSEQTAANAKKPQSKHVWQIDKLVYQLVENNVNYAGEQFSENLKFNSETLTNVLYDNIYKLLGEKFEEDEFIDWLVEELLANGAIIQTGETAEPVSTIDPEQYQALVSKIDAAIKLIQANKLAIFKAIAGLSDGMEKDGGSDESMDKERDVQITTLVEKIHNNQEKLVEHVDVHTETKDEIAEKIDEIQAEIENHIHTQGELLKTNQKVTDNIQKTIKRIGSNVPQKPKGAFGANLANIGKNPKAITKLFLNTNKKSPVMGRIGLKIQPLKKKKPGVVQKLGAAMKNLGRKIRDKISKSFIGKTYRAVKKAVQMVGKVIKKVYTAIKKTVKAVYKTAKFAAKAFWGASKLVGKGVRAVGRGAIKGVKKMINLAKAGKLGKAIQNFAPAQLVTKMGFRVIKFIGKQLWKGIKKLVFKAVNFFKSLFKMGGKFLNKVGMWMGKLSIGIKDKAYRFLVKPIANIMVTVFNFFTGVLMSPIQFMKWLVPSVFDRILSALSNIGQGVKKALKATGGIFKKILCNPLTIAILIGGAFFFLGKWLYEKLTGETQGIAHKIMDFVMGIVTPVWGFLKGVWGIVLTVGKFLFEWIAKITDPESWIVKAVTWVIKAFLAIKGFIKKMMMATGKDSIDVFCMFLAGDYIGIVIHAIAGMVIKFWQWLRNLKFFRIAFGIVKALIKIYAMIWKIPLVLGESLLRAGVALGKWIISFGKWGSLGDIGEQFAKPWKEWWGGIKSIFDEGADDVSYEMNREVLTKDPTEDNKEKATRANIAVRSLKMKGTAEKNLALLDSLGGQNISGNLLKRIQNMNSLYQTNSEQVEQYSEFLSKTWEMGKGDAELSQQVLKQMLESPEISARLLSAFFYYNPQTGETQMLRPAAYIGQFLDNLRQMMNAPDRDDEEAFKTVIEAFDQLNKERSHIINNQGDIIADFAERIFKLNQNEKDESKSGLKQLKEDVTKFNNGNMFDNISVGSSFEQMRRGDAKTQEIKSVTGDQLGTNKLLRVPPQRAARAAGASPKDFTAMPPPEQPREQIGNILLPPGSNPAPPPNPNLQADASGKSLLDKWREHQNTRAGLMAAGKGKDEVNAMGYEALTFEEFKARQNKINPVPVKDIEAQEENKAKRLAALRTAKDVAAYHNQGKFANRDGFRMGKKPSILKIPTDGLDSVLYMFSPDWQKMQGASKLSDDQLLLEIDAGDYKARERIRKAKEAEMAKKKAEELKKRREQAILDYSAKVSGGYIEVKVGEDLVAMEGAYKAHMNALSQFLASGHNQKEADERGLFNFTWEQFKRHYRKMHGLPEDGIKRIPFEGKRKERQIDWSTRYALSTEEMSKYGIEMSQDGPVMIPLDKAMEAASSIIKGAKTIHSIRDGLEIMRQGLSTETAKLKKQREEGVPAAVIQNKTDTGENVSPTPPESSSYSDPG